jgi:hypothetical protein
MEQDEAGRFIHGTATRLQNMLVYPAEWCLPLHDATHWFEMELYDLLAANEDLDLRGIDYDDGGEFDMGGFQIEDGSEPEFVAFLIRIISSGALMESVDRSVLLAENEEEIAFAEAH